MDEKQRSPWLPVSLVVVGLVVGYSIVAFRGEAQAQRFCPAHAASVQGMQHS